MRDWNRQGIGDSTKREVILEVEDKGFDNDVNGESEEFERMDRERHRLREERDSTIGVAMSASEDDKREANFSDIHGF